MDEIKEHEMKIQVTAEYKRRLRLILKSKLNAKNEIQAINTWAVALLRYGAGIINWKVDELKKNGQNHGKDFDDVWGASSRVTLINYI